MKEYIDKAAVIEELKKRIEKYKILHSNSQLNLSKIALKENIVEYYNFLSFLDTLEVKEVGEPSNDLDGYKEVSFELIPYSANIAVGGNEYFLQAKVTDKDLSQIGVSGFLYKLKLKVKA